jgi:hypothetical protein
MKLPYVVAALALSAGTSAAQSVSPVHGSANTSLPWAMTAPTGVAATRRIEPGVSGQLAAPVPLVPPAQPTPVPSPVAVPAPVAPRAPAGLPAIAVPFGGFDVDVPWPLQLDITRDLVHTVTVEAQERVRELNRELASLQTRIAQSAQGTSRDNEPRVLKEKVVELQAAVRLAAEDARRSVEVQLGGGPYTSGLNALNRRQYDRAIEEFTRVIDQKGARADGALYHKAFAQFRSGRTQEALDTIAALRRDHPESRYLGDAKVLEADVRRSVGQPVNPAAADDDEIKLLAIQGLPRSEQAVSLLEGVLNATNSLAVKRRALFVLAQNSDPRARAILLRYAKGEGNPDLQMEAIGYLTSRRDQTSSRDLRDIYEAATDISVKLAVVNALVGASDKSMLVGILADRAAAIEVRGRAANGLASLISADELWTIYQQEQDARVRSQIVSAFGGMRAVEHLARVARTDADTSVRRRAIGILGGQRGDQAAKVRQLLVDLYSSQPDTAVRMTIISAFSGPDSAEALVSLARKETTLDLKRAIVQRLSDMASQSKVAADYLMEVIK